MLKLKFLLWMLARLLKKAYKKQPAMREHLASKPLSFTLATQDWPGRQFHLRAEGVESQTQSEAEVDLKLVFTDAASAWQALTSKDKNAIMRAIQDKKLSIEGAPNKLFELQGVMKWIKI
ncbi:SCP2 sterol-binding domain-containing protein [Marinospirillum sp.]|uniref:SCP2 sterol-binding domain-containing protein n=1 Tax=Marinospirillum sp. TaxID=2183934 RepID=UPI003A858C73